MEPAVADAEQGRGDVDAGQVDQTASSRAPTAMTRLETITSGLRRPVRSDQMPPPTAVETAPAADR